VIVEGFPSERAAKPSTIMGRPLPRAAFIVYRRLTMNADEARPLDRITAVEYASWFRALADPTRIQIVSLLARRGGSMNVGEIVAAVDVGQSTVSAHLKVLTEVRFLLSEHQGTATYYRINNACVDCFPTAADIVMGRPVPAGEGPALPLPWSAWLAPGCIATARCVASPAIPRFPADRCR
jgi:DNA-binding transcriptional ArsR family regulator